MTLLRLANAIEGRAILAAEDDFTRALGSFDRSFRLRTTEKVSDVALREFLGEQAEDFTTEETAAWEEAIAVLAKGAHGLGPLLPPEVLILKTSGREERDHAYTRANAIMLPRGRVQTWRGERAIRLLAHELFHVASRVTPGLRDKTYALLGFEPLARLEPPPELDDTRMSNPDAYALSHYVKFGERAFVPLLTCPHPLADVLDKTTVVGVMNTSLLEIDPTAHSIVRDSNGAPVLVDPGLTEWPKRLTRNTKYTIHPEEVLADNFALMVMRRLGSSSQPSDSEFLNAFAATLNDQQA